MTLAFGMWRQGDSEFEVILGYIVNFRRPCLKYSTPPKPKQTRPMKRKTQMELWGK